MVSTRRKRYSQGTKIDVEDGSRAEEAPVVASERKARGTRSLGNEKDAKKEEDDGGEAPEEVGFEESKREAMQRHQERPTVKRTKVPSKRKRSRSLNGEGMVSDVEKASTDVDQTLEESIEIQEERQPMLSRTSAPSTSRKPKPKTQKVKIGRFEIQVLPKQGNTEMRPVSASAKSFLQAKLGKKRRSHSMLLPRHAPALQF